MVSVLLGGVFGSQGGSVVSSWLVVDWSGVVDRGSVVNRGRLVWGRNNFNNRCRFIRSRGNLDNWGRFVWCWGRGIDNRGRFVRCWGRLVWSRGRDNLHNRGRGNFDNRLVWSRGGFVCWGRGRFVGLHLSIDSLAFILHISNIALGSSGVCDDLDTAVRKVNSVLSAGVVVSTVLLLGENSSGVLGVVHSILVVVYWRKVWICFLGGVRGGGTSGRRYGYKRGKKDL